MQGLQVDLSRTNQIQAGGRESGLTEIALFEGILGTCTESLEASQPRVRRLFYFFEERVYMSLPRPIGHGLGKVKHLDGL